MKINAKKITILRLLASFMLFIVLCGLFILDFFLINHLIIYLMLLSIIFLTISFSFSLKLEWDFIKKNLKTISFLLIVISLIAVTFTLILINNYVLNLIFILTLASNLLLIYSWHSCLSIFKKLKYFSILSFLIANIILIIFLYFIINTFDILISFLVILCSYNILYISILCIELIMRKKGYLNYI